MTATDQAAARFGIKVDDDNGYHIRFGLYAATGGEHLGRCGDLVMRPDEYAAFRELLAPALTDRTDPPALERVKTSDGCYRMLRFGAGAGALTFDPHTETIDADWLPLGVGRSWAATAADILHRHGEDHLWQYLENLCHQMSEDTR